MRLSYHGWAATLLVLAFLLVAGGVALGVAPSSPISTLPSGESVTLTCGSAWAPNTPETPACATLLAERSSAGGLFILLGIVLFGGILLVGMLVAGVRHALAEQARPADTPAAPPVD